MYKRQDSNGVATLTIPGMDIGKYSINFTFAGDKHFSASSGSGKITVRTPTTKFTSSTLNMVYKDGSKFKVKLTKNGKALANKYVKFVFNGKTYTVKTTAYGNAYLKIPDLKPGTYSIKFYYLTNGYADYCYGSGNLKDYLSVAKNLIKTADAEGKVPNVVSSDVGSIGYKSLVYAFSRVISFYDDENVMPAYVEIKPLPTKDSSLMAYLAATANCQVNSTKIKLLVDKLTKGLTSEKSKAKAIFNYVRDHISYSFYYDTKYGAVGTLESGNGNCVDHAHLLAAMFRTAGLATKYVHGTCTFSSGSTYGHVWNQVLIDGVWTVADATSSRNSLGTIVNWNTGSYSLHGYYASLPF